MLLKKLKDFHERTMEQYKEEENLEPWKKKVMEFTHLEIFQKVNIGYQKLIHQVDISI